MALESVGTQTAKQIDYAFKLCHDVLLHEGPEAAGKLELGVKGMWEVYANDLDGKPAVFIAICVG